MLSVTLRWTEHQASPLDSLCLIGLIQLVPGKAVKRKHEAGGFRGTHDAVDVRVEILARAGAHGVGEQGDHRVDRAPPPAGPVADFVNESFPATAIELRPIAPVLDSRRRSIICQVEDRPEYAEIRIF